MSKICSKCKIEKDESEFYANKISVDGLDYYCKECRKRQIYEGRKNKVNQTVDCCDTDNGNQYHANREFVESLKTDCVKCGEDRPWIIQFHHVDHRTKEFNVTQAATRSRAIIWKEACKCVCLCANCHNEFHHFFGKNPNDPIADFEKYMNEDF